MRWLVAMVACAGCVESRAVQCDFGLTCPEDWMCDATHKGCIKSEQLTVCAQKNDQDPCSTALIDSGVCDAGVCLGARCGDGVRAPSEICDGMQFATVSNCNQVGFYDNKQLACSATCELDHTMCSGRCGDGVVNGPELCDGADPVGTTCVDLGQGAGNLGCAQTCSADLSGCIPFGWRAYTFPETVAAIHGTSSSNVWVVGYNGLVQRFDGTAWHPVDVSACSSTFFEAVFVLSETDAVIAAGTGVVRVTATGCTYDQIPGAQLIQGLWAASMNDIFAGTTSQAYHFDGTSWQSSSFHPSRVLWGRNGHDVYAADGVPPLPSPIWHYDGQNWSDFPITGTFSNGISGLWGTADTLYVSGTSSNAAQVLAYRQGTWSNAFVGHPGYEVASNAYDGVGNATHNFVVASNTGGHLLGGDGTSWVDLDAPFFQDLAKPYLSPEGALYLAISARNFVYVFGGSTRLSTKPVPGQVERLAVRSGDEAFIVVSGRLCRWNTVAWTEEETDTDVTVAADGSVIVLGASLRQWTAPGMYTPIHAVGGSRVSAQSPTDILLLDSQGKLAHYDGTLSSTTPPATIRDLLSVTPSFGIAVGDGVIMHWNGSTWTQQTTPLTQLEFLYAVTAASPTDAYALSYYSLLRWDGVSWTMQTPPPGVQLRSVFGRTGDLFVGTDTGLWHHDGIRWSPVDTGDIAPVEHLAGRGSSIYWVEPDSVDQLFRSRPW